MMAQGGAARSTDFLTLDELGQRLRLSPKTLRRLHHEAGLPLYRATARGPIYAWWSDVENWLRKQKQQKS